MPQSFQRTYDLTREDIVTAIELQLRDHAVWKEVQAQYQRTQRRSALWMAPVVIAGSTLLIGRTTGGMYWEGAGIGLAFAVALFFALPQLNEVEKAKKAHSEKIKRADFSAYTGTINLEIDEKGVHFHTATCQLKVTWQTVTPLAVDGFVLLQLSAGDQICIPRRVFASQAEADEFFAHTQAWREAAKLPHAERLARYLSDRDLPCPGCKYNLRGVKSENCPECGTALQFEKLIAM